MQEDIINTPTKKVYYLLSLFQSGNAKLWKEQYIRQRDGRALCEGNDWERFKTILKDNFRDTGSKDEAMMRLQTMRQRKGQSINEFNTQFRIKIQKSEMDEQTTADILCQMYGKAINAKLSKRILIQGALVTLSAWMHQASTLDSYERRAN